MENPFTGYSIRDKRIRGPSHDGEFYLTNDYIYGPFNSGKYYIGASKQIFGPGQSGQFYVRGNRIYGPSTTLPWLDDPPATAP